MQSNSAANGRARSPDFKGEWKSISKESQPLFGFKASGPPRTSQLSTLSPRTSWTSSPHPRRRCLLQARRGSRRRRTYRRPPRTCLPGALSSSAQTTPSPLNLSPTAKDLPRPTLAFLSPTRSAQHSGLRAFPLARLPSPIEDFEDDLVSTSTPTPSGPWLASAAKAFQSLR